MKSDNRWMKRFSILDLRMAIPALLFTALATGCGGGKDEPGKVSAEGGESSSGSILSGTEDDAFSLEFSGLKTAIATSNTVVDLSWEPATDNTTPSTDVAYEIYQSLYDHRSDLVDPFLSNRSRKALYKIVGATNYSVGGLVEGTTYFFSVRAVDKAGNVDSNTATIRVHLPSNTKVNTITAGTEHTCVLISNGSIKCWGNNSDGEVGNIGRATIMVPLNVCADESCTSPLLGATACMAGLRHTCAAMLDGSVQCWGSNSAGQLGVGKQIVKGMTPLQVPGLSGVTTVSTGADSSCAILLDGTVRCWGDNNAGQLGDGTKTSRESPVTVSGLSGAIQVAPGGDLSCAIIQGGHVRCWGILAPGGGLTAVPIEGIEGDATGIVAGNRHACAILADKSIACWGDDNRAQLGTFEGSYSEKAVGVKLFNVGVLSDAVGLIVGNDESMNTTCAVLGNGRGVCWGFGNTFVVPKEKDLALENLVSLAFGQRHLCGLFRDGSVQCGGSSDNQMVSVADLQ